MWKNLEENINQMGENTEDIQKIIVKESKGTSKNEKCAIWNEKLFQWA